MIRRIALKRIKPDPDQPRKTFAGIEALAASIEQQGLIQPITVRRPRKGQSAFIIIAGERRFRAHQLLVEQGKRRFATIECNVKPHAHPRSPDTLLKQIAENVMRDDMEPMDEARSYARLRDDYGMTPEQISARLGLGFRVAWRLSLLNLSPPLAKLLETGHLDKQLALEAARLPDHRQQTALVQLVNRGQLSGWKSIRNAVDAMLAGTTAEDLFGTTVKPTRAELAAVDSMEKRIDHVKRMVASGWKAGECVIANKVDPGRAAKLAGEIEAIGSALRIMARELRNVGGQAVIALEKVA